MSQQNINTPASESKESSVFKGQDCLSETGELLGEGFIALVKSELVASQLGRYQFTRAQIEEVAHDVNNGDNSPAVAHFISGNLSGCRGGYAVPGEPCLTPGTGPLGRNDMKPAKLAAGAFPPAQKKADRWWALTPGRIRTLPAQTVQSRLAGHTHKVRSCDTPQTGCLRS